MELHFQRGTEQQPRGHALLYFDDASEPDRAMATYVVVLPLTVDLSRYLPPMFLSQLQMGQLDFQDMSGFAFPPVPEPVQDRRLLERLAELRGDDLLYGGSLATDDLQRSVTAVSEIVQRYAALLQDVQRQASEEVGREAERTREGEGAGELGVSQVMYELMSPRARLEEISRMLGKLRFALDGSDTRLGAEAQEEIRELSRHFPDHYRLPDLLEAARRSDPANRRLAELYLERCYRLLEEEYSRAREIEAEIARLQMSE